MRINDFIAKKKERKNLSFALTSELHSHIDVIKAINRNFIGLLEKFANHRALSRGLQTFLVFSQRPV